jgi:hypothetical protein
LSNLPKCSSAQLQKCPTDWYAVFSQYAATNLSRQCRETALRAAANGSRLQTVCRIRMSPQQPTSLAQGPGGRGRPRCHLEFAYCRHPLPQGSGQEPTRTHQPCSRVWWGNNMNKCATKRYSPLLKKKHEPATTHQPCSRVWWARPWSATWSSLTAATPSRRVAARSLRVPTSLAQGSGGAKNTPRCQPWTSKMTTKDSKFRLSTVWTSKGKTRRTETD